jgi:small GTP-binding protein
MGDTSVGKTSLLNVYMKGVFPDKNLPTIGVEFASKLITLKDNSKIKIQIFDTAGQEKYRSIVSNYCRKALGCFLVFDITHKSTFEQCKNFLYDIKQIAEPDCVFLLVGNKIDLEDQREVGKDEAMKYATENKMYYIETSALTKFKVNDAFEKLFECNYLFFFNLFLLFFSGC